MSKKPETPAAARCVISIDYCASFYDAQDRLIKNPDKERERAECATAALRHLSGIFFLLTMLDEAKLEQANINSLATALENLGGLGGALAEDAFSAVAEME